MTHTATTARDAVIGVINGVYTKRDTIYLEVGYAFGGKPRR